ncbi:MAG: hypothetical protein VW405_08650 [Rhodospirillaceae bacterium]
MPQVYLATVDDAGRVRPRDLGAFYRHCRALAGEVVEVVVGPPRRRARPAPRRYWALLTTAARSLGWDGPTELHDAVASHLLALPPDARTGLPRRRRTPSMRSAAFTAYVDQVEAFLVSHGADLTGWQDEVDA